MGKLFSYFRFEENGATLKHELMAGFTIYFSMAYVIFVIPLTLINVFPGACDDRGMPIYSAMIGSYTVSQILTSLTVATCLASALGTAIMAFYARLPLVLAPSLSVSVFFTYTVCLSMGYTYNQALAAVFLSGAIFITFTLFGWRNFIVHAIPDNLKFSIAAGIGILLATTGLIKAKIIISDPQTIIGFNKTITLASPQGINVLLTLATIVIITILLKKKIHGAIFLGEIICLVAAFALNIVDFSNFSWGNNLFGMPVFQQLDFAGLFKLHNNTVLGTLMVIINVLISITLVDVFDSIGTLIGTGYKVGLLDANLRMHKLNKAMMTDALATSVGACLGTPSVSIYAESTTGIAEEGKTGFTALVASVLFLLSIFIAPFIRLFPSAATAATLTIVGALMLNSVTYINFDEISDVIPAFVTIIMIPLTYSIATGIGLGIICYTLIKLFSGHRYEIHPSLYVLTFIFGLRLFFPY
jgi:AGZA family xanthine/uracil permease-like MFS transporter